MVLFHKVVDNMDGKEEKKVAFIFFCPSSVSASGHCAIIHPRPGGEYSDGKQRLECWNVRGFHILPADNPDSIIWAGLFDIFLSFWSFHYANGRKTTKPPPYRYARGIKNLEPCPYRYARGHKKP